MANTAYLSADKQMVEEYIAAHTFKVMLCNSDYTPDNEHDFVDAGGASDPLDAEISLTGYAGGWGGSGRKTAGFTVTEDAANNRIAIVLDDITWTSVAAGDTILNAILIIEGTSDDTDSQLVRAWAVADGATSGSDVVLSGATWYINVPAVPA
jgi:hypothetical protein